MAFVHSRGLVILALLMGAMMAQARDGPFGAVGTIAGRSLAAVNAAAPTKPEAAAVSVSSVKSTNDIWRDGMLGEAPWSNTHTHDPNHDKYEEGRTGMDSFADFGGAPTK